MVNHVHTATVDYPMFSTGFFNPACCHVRIRPRVYTPCIDVRAYYQGCPGKLSPSVHDNHIVTTFQVGYFVVMNAWFLACNNPPFRFIDGLIALGVGAVPGLPEELPQVQLKCLVHLFDGCGGKAPYGALVPCTVN